MKYECLGHYQKRVGNRLRKLRQRVKGLGGKDKTTEVARQTLDGKIIKVTKKAKGKITDASIDILQNYFGIALRSGAKSVPELKKAFSTLPLRKTVTSILIVPPQKIQHYSIYKLNPKHLDSVPPGSEGRSIFCPMFYPFFD